MNDSQDRSNLARSATLVLVLMLGLSGAVVLALCAREAAALDALKVGVALSDRQIAPGQQAAFEFTAPASVAYRVRVDHQGLDIAISVERAGETLASDLPVQIYGYETLLFDASKGQTCRLMVSSKSGGLGGSFDIVVRPTGDSGARARAAGLADDANRVRPKGSIGSAAYARQYAVAAEAWRNVGEPAEEARMRFGEAAARMHAGETRQAELEFHRAAGLFATAGQVWPEMWSEYLGASLVVNQGDFAVARQRFAALRLRALHLENRFLASATLNYIALTHHYQGDFDQALELYRETLDELPANADHTRATILHNIAGIAYERGDAQEAVRQYTEALAARLQDGNKMGISATIEEIGSSYALMGDCNSALPHYQRALEAIGDAETISTGEIREEKNSRARILRRTADCNRTLGNATVAMDAYRRSRQLFEEIGDAYGQASVLSRLGTLHRDLGGARRGLTLHKNALEIHAKAQNNGDKAAALVEIGRDELALGRPLEARRRAEDAIELARRMGAAGYVADAQHLRGQALLKLGRHEAALEALAGAGQWYQDNASDLAQLRLMPDLARAYRELGDEEQAAASLAAGMALTEKVRGTFGSAQMRASFFGSAQDIYLTEIDRLLDAFAATGDGAFKERAWWLNALRRGRALRESSDRRSLAATSLPDKLKSQVETLRASITGQLARLDALSHQESKAPAAKELLDSVLARRLELDALLATYGREATATAAENTGATQALALLKSELDDDTLLLDFAVRSDGTDIWIIGHDRFELFRSAVAVATDTAVKIDTRSMRKTVTALGAMLEPILDAYGDAQKLVFVPDGVVGVAPLAMTPVHGRRLVTTHEISVSISALRAPQPTTRFNRQHLSLALIGDPVFDSSDPRYAQSSPRLAATQ